MFGTRIKDLRIEHNLTQQQLANILKVDRTTVMKWETNVCETSFEMLKIIAEYFDVTCDYLVGKSDY